MIKTVTSVGSFRCLYMPASAAAQFVSALLLDAVAAPCAITSYGRSVVLHFGGVLVVKVRTTVLCFRLCDPVPCFQLTDVVLWRPEGSIHLDIILLVYFICFVAGVFCIHHVVKFFLAFYNEFILSFFQTLQSKPTIQSRDGGIVPGYVTAPMGLFVLCKLLET